MIGARSLRPVASRSCTKAMAQVSLARVASQRVSRSLAFDRRLDGWPCNCGPSRRKDDESSCGSPPAPAAPPDRSDGSRRDTSTVPSGGPQRPGVSRRPGRSTPRRTQPASEPASELSANDLLQHLLVEAELRDALLEPRVPVPERLPTAHPARRQAGPSSGGQAWNPARPIPALRRTRPAGTPSSVRTRTNAFRASEPPPRLHRTTLLRRRGRDARD